MNIFRRDSDDDRTNDARKTPRGAGGGRGPQIPNPAGRPFRTMAFWVLVALLALVAYRMYSGSLLTTQRIDIPYARFMAEVEKGNVDNASFAEQSRAVTGELKVDAVEKVAGRDVTFKSFKTNFLGDGALLADKVRASGAKVNVTALGIDWMSMLFSWLPLVLFLVAWMFVLRQMQGGGNAAMRFGKSKARVLMESQTKVTFKDVAGCDEAKQELQEIIEFLKEPQKFQRLGGRIPKGALLLGPPGSGKTLLARAVAGEAGVPFFSMSGSDFVEMFVGVGASRVRDLFEQAKRNAPCLTGDTMITLSGGREVSIREMYENDMIGASVPAMAEDFRFGEAKVIHITCKPSTDLFEIRTTTSAIKATGNHQFPVWRDGSMHWVTVDQMRVGDHVAMPRVIPTTPQRTMFTSLLPAEDTLVHLKGDVRGTRRMRLHEIGEDMPAWHASVEGLSMGSGGFASSRIDRFPLELSEDLAYVCGLIAADGAFGNDGDRSIQFVNTEMALHERVSQVLEREFGYSPKRHMNTKHYETILPQGRRPVVLQDCWTTFINSKLLCTALRSLNARILEMHADYAAAWLRGVFDGDGHVRVSASCPQVYISAWKRSENDRIRGALLRVGIPTSKSPRSHEDRDGNICISGLEPIRRFWSRIHSDHPKKQAAFERLMDLLSSRDTSSSRFDSIPVGPALAEARRSLGMGQRAFQRGHVISSYERGLNSPSRSSLQAVVEEMEVWNEANEVTLTSEFELVRDLSHSAVLWTRVEVITPLTPGEPVYDLCLDRYHNFVANRLFTHNCIVFVDEIDAVGRHRGAGLGGGHDEREQTLNQLLVEMDGFESNEGVIMVAATNRPDVLDPALLRPGRFDRQIVVDWPDVRGREGILKVHTRRIPLAEDVDLKAIARSTPGMAGAELANIVNEAALLAARRNHKKVSDRDFEDAKDKVMMGAERRSLVMTEEERKTTAYHEAGHALVAWLLPGSDPVTKVTIIPRGRALGVTFYTPQEERHNHSKKQLEDRLCHAMGGRAAELLSFHHLTTGAANDLEQATNIARSMVTRFGMSDKLGPLTFGKKEEMVFLGRELSSHKDYSEQTAVLIDSEVRDIIERANNQAMDLLRNNLDKLALLANTLLERETIDGDEMDRVLRGEKLEPLPKIEELDPPAQQQVAQGNEGQQLDAFGQPQPRPAGA